MRENLWKIDRLGSYPIDHVMRIHLRAFPDFFLTLLGPRFLREFYRAFLNDETSIAFAAEDESGNVVGVVVGTGQPVGFFRRLLIRRWWAFGLASLAPILKNPSIGKRIFRALAYRGDPPSRPGYALLSSIAVAPDTQGIGLGKALLDVWIKEAKKRSCRGAYLTTDALHNDTVNSFYRNAGWRLESFFLTAEGRKMNRYAISFDDSGLR
jgi:GNAT superfamily N-acetyltransferase